MANNRAYELAEAQIERDYEEGRITLSEFNAEMRDMAREYQAEAEEAARAAYAAELERW